MVGFSSWAEVLQTFGGLAGVFLAAAALNRDAKAREDNNVLTMASQHRQLWEAASARPGLKRVFARDVQLANAPLTSEEEDFLNVKIVHFMTGWRLAKRSGARAAISLVELERDACGFFALPLPGLVWQRAKAYKNPDFVRFVDDALAKLQSPTR